MSSWSWWDELEQKLEQQLEAFLKSHPEQSERLRQEQLNEAAQLRRQLLELAAEIKQWQERTQKARYGSGLFSPSLQPPTEVL